MSEPSINKQNIQPAARIIIRNRIKTILVPNTDLGGRWYCSRPKSVFLDEMPCGLIYFTDEDADHEQSAPRTYTRILQLKTEVIHRLESERANALDDFLDSRAYEIEETMFWNRFLGLPGLVEDVVYKRTEATDVKVEGDADIASLAIYWEIQYRTEILLTETLNEFLRYLVGYTTAEGATANDSVTIREE